MSHSTSPNGEDEAWTVRVRLFCWCSLGCSAGRNTPVWRVSGAKGLGTCLPKDGTLTAQDERKKEEGLQEFARFANSTLRMRLNNDDCIQESKRPVTWRCLLARRNRKALLRSRAAF